MKSILPIRSYFLWLLIVCVTELDATVVIPAEGGAASRLVGVVEAYTITNDGVLPTRWSQLARHDPMLRGLNSYVEDGQEIDDLYSFVRADDRSKFPKGKLILIRATPMDWPDVWDHLKHIDPSSLSAEERKRYEQSEARQKPIRYLIYQNEADRIESAWWYEEDVQKMLIETGIEVPEPEPYTYQTASPPARFAPEVEEAAQESAALEPEIEESAEVAPIGKKTAEPTAQPTQQPSNWWLWLIGAVVVIGALGSVFRRKN